MKCRRSFGNRGMPCQAGGYISIGTMKELCCHKNLWVSDKNRHACSNICLSELFSLHESILIGEGTFGKCLAGKYKQFPVAIKVFENCQNVKCIHEEANIVLMIPSNPNIAMLIAVQTIKKPYLLITKLCLSNRKPQTYSGYLEELDQLDKKNWKHVWKYCCE